VPSISTLAAEHGGLARQTCAKALRKLEAKGLLLRVCGPGYFLSDRGGTLAGGARQLPILRVADRLGSRRDDE
jgi:DNA-binding transcriptional regulator YhcF (GntR family)